MIYINARFLTQDITGAQRYAAEMSKAFKELRPDGAEFLTPKKIVSKEISGFLDAKPLGKLSGHLWEQVELPRYLKGKDNPLLINLANTAPLNYENQIVTIDDLSFLRHPEWFSKIFYLYYSFLIPRITKKSKQIITISDFSKREIIELLGIPESKIMVIYPSISKEFIDPRPIDNKYGNYILAVSSLDQRKNFNNLIAAFNSLNLSDTKLIIVGKTDNMIFSGKRIDVKNNLNNVVFTGYISDYELAGLYKNARIFIYPSFYEGFGLPPLEAMGCGCPVVISRLASLPEVCGDAAYYINPYKAEDIAEAIRNILNNGFLREDLINKGRERIKLFSWRDSAQRLIRISQ